MKDLFPMNAPYGIQLVEVIDEYRLRDANECEWRYWRRDGKPLRPGYYVVWLAPAGCCTRFGEDADFSGPYHGPRAARAALECARRGRG